MELGESRSDSYYCHKCNCNVTVQVSSTDTCPLCNDGFIEKLNPSSFSSIADRNSEHTEDTDSVPAVLRHFSENFGVLVQGGDSSQGNLSDHRPSSSNRRDASSDAAQGNDRRRTRNQNYATTFEHVFSELLSSMTRPNAANLDGNAPLFLLSNPPGDYAWGREGLDTIVTQLLNQMDSSGPPPLANDKIDAIPFVVVTDAQVSENIQCSVCWESFIQAEHVRQLPCEHIYHDACILPWLQLHGTCPICRKLLCDDNETRIGFSHTGNLEALFSNVQGFSIYPSGSRRRANSRRIIRCWNCSNFGHMARDCYNRQNRNNRSQQWQPQGQQQGQPHQSSASNESGAGANVTTDWTTTSTGAHPYVDIDDLDEDDDDDDMYDVDDVYSDYDYELNYDCESELSDFDLDLMSFSGGSSSSTHFCFGGAPSVVNGWPSRTTVAGFGDGRSRSQIYCFQCKGLGHKSHQCTARRFNASPSSSYSQPKRECCCYCARLNHTSDKCFYKPTDNNGASSTSASTSSNNTSAARLSQRGNKSPSQSRYNNNSVRASSTIGNNRVSAVRPSFSRLKLQPSQQRYKSPPPPHRLTPPPALSSSSSSSVARSFLRGGSGSRDYTRQGSTFGRMGTPSQRHHELICYKCNQPGHRSRHCKNETRSCWVCGEIGHLSRDCPQSL